MVLYAKIIIDMGYAKNYVLFLALCQSSVLLPVTEQEYNLIYDGLQAAIASFPEDHALGAFIKQCDLLHGEAVSAASQLTVDNLKGIVRPCCGGGKVV